ncbi:hypothetical protein AGMMS49942_11850 [Spirochaetia bacterium]|nr:hypothetical protein AGMMS49942_11850 [Spirochaetia bacterium]
MKKNSFLWLLPLAAALFLVVSSDLFALSDKDEKQLTKLEQTLAKKGKLSTRDQTKYDQLKAAKAAEDLQQVPPLAPPSQDLGGAAIAQSPTTAIAPQLETVTVGLDGKPDVGFTGTDATGLIVQKEPEPLKDGPKKLDPDKEYPAWVSDPYSLETLIRDAIKENTEGDENAKKVAGNEFSLKDVYVGIGSATNAADSQAIQMAEARARQDLAFQQQALVKAEITDYSKNMTSTKGGLSNAAEDYIVAQQSIDMELTPVKVQIREKIKGAWWVVVTATKVPERRATVEEGPYVPSAMEAVRLMDQRLERNKIRSTTVSPATTEVGSEAISGMLND